MRERTQLVTAFALALVALANPVGAQAPEPAPSEANEEANDEATESAEVAPQEAPPAERPWAEGVDAEAQSAALARFREANAAFARPDYAEAARLYRDALMHWDHPAIHGNLAVSLVHLDQPIAAFEHLELALRWGSAPFDPSHMQQLETNRRLLQGQLARITVRSDREGAEVVLDGERLFLAPGEETRIVRAGSHRLVATLDDHLTYVEEVVLNGADERTVEPTFVSLDDAAQYERRLPTAVPWAALGAGVAVGLVGVGLQVSAARLINDYENEVAQRCPTGCTADQLSQAVLDQRTDGERRNAAAVVTMTIGGLATIAGIALIVLNQPRRVEVTPEGARETAAVRVAPFAGPRAAGVSLAGSF